MTPRRKLPALLVGAILAFISFTATAAQDLGWDLSYAKLVGKPGIADNEYVRLWANENPQRLAQKMIADYDGEPIDFSVLIEKPSDHSPRSSLWWIVKAGKNTKLCFVGESSGESPVQCEAVAYHRFERFRQVLGKFKPFPMPNSADLLNVPLGGRKVALHYQGFLSIFDKGKSSQRLITLGEFFIYSADARQRFGPDEGRIDRALGLLEKNDAEVLRMWALVDLMRAGDVFTSAIEKGDVEKVRQVLDAAPDGGETFLREGVNMTKVVLGRHVALLEYLLSRKVDVREVWGSGDSPLLIAARVSAQQDMTEITNLLLKAGARPNAINQRCETAYSIAMRSGSPEMQELLGANGGDMAVVDACLQKRSRR